MQQAHSQTHPRIAFWLVLLVVFLDWTGIGLVYPIFSAMLFHPDCPILHESTSHALRGWYLGVLLASMSIAQFFSSPILGSLSDQKGRKPIFIITLLLTAVGYLLSAGAIWGESLGYLILSRVVVGLAAGNASVVSATIADLSSHENKTKNFGLFSMACGVGFTLGPFLGGELSQFGFAVPFICSAIATLTNTLLMLYYFKETHIPDPQTIARGYLDGFKDVIKAFKIKNLRLIFAVVFIFCIGWSFFYEFISVTWISDYGFDAAKVGFFYAYGSGFYAISSGILIRPIVDRFRNNVVFFYTLIANGLLFLFLLIKPPPIWVWVYLPVVNFLGALLYPTSTAMVSDMASDEEQGEVLGILQSVQAAAFGLSPLAAGSLLGNNPHMPMVLGGSSMLLAALLLASSMQWRR